MKTLIGKFVVKKTFYDGSNFAPGAPNAANWAIKIFKVVKMFRLIFFKTEEEKRLKISKIPPPDL